MHIERVKLDIEYDINGFERTILERLLSSFETIEAEAKEKRQKFLEYTSKNFNPEHDDEGRIEEDGYFEEVNQIHIEESLKQEFLNSTVSWLFHLFEKQKIKVFGTHLTDALKSKLLYNNYDLNTCPNWRILNKEIRFAANAIKHGVQSQAMSGLIQNYPSLVENNVVVISRSEIIRYLSALRCFWEKALQNQVVL